MGSDHVSSECSQCPQGAVCVSDDSSVSIWWHGRTVAASTVPQYPPNKEKHPNRESFPRIVTVAKSERIGLIITRYVKEAIFSISEKNLPE